ncbi:hypothetical protein SAMN05216210_2615 [Halopseudomonas salegens]|uniref:Uncharacterized protein n=1 Tax=Halopseudomonas salegens TaxID=1434072 RepID=A0A1H2GXZ9_9GAMM|nr:hypothetical protein SAMN05216210_2615 [Halopseudomonas salegens]
MATSMVKAVLSTESLPLAARFKPQENRDTPGFFVSDYRLLSGLGWLHYRVATFLAMMMVWSKG